MDLMFKQNVNYFIVSAASRNTQRIDAKQVTNWRICAALDKAGEKSDNFAENASKIRRPALSSRILTTS